MATNLRQSNFSTGNYTVTPFITTNQVTLNNTPKPQKQFPNIKEEKIDLVAQKANLRASHFSLGGDYNINYSTTRNAHFGYKNKECEKAQLSEAKQKDLKTHHILLGQYAPTTQTTNNLNYYEKEQQKNLQKKQLLQKAIMIAHNHSFKEQPNIVITSQYNTEFNQQFKPEENHYGKTQQEVQEKAKDLRSTHIVFGQDQKPYETIQQKDFTRKENPTLYMHKTDLQGSHFNLGNQKDEMCSTNDVYLTQKLYQKTELEEQNLKDLKESHFKLGVQADLHTYTSEFKQNYVQKKAPQKDNFLTTQKNNFNIGDEDVYKTSYQTSYSKNMRPQTAVQSKSRNAGDDRGTNFGVGQQPPIRVSEMKHQYQNFTNGGTAPAPASNDTFKRDLQSSHFKLQNASYNSYQTTNAQHFHQMNLDKGGGKLDAQLEKELRGHHFALGQHVRDYKTQAQDTHGHFGKAEPASLAKGVANDLKAHHFTLS